MNKRVLMPLAILVLFSSQAFCQSVAKKGMIADPGTLGVNAGVSMGWGTGFVGGAEHIIGRINLESIPLTYGVAGRVGMYFGNEMAASVGGLGSLHLCLAAFDLPDGTDWLGNFDIYLGLGLGISDKVRLGWLSGLAYYFNDSLAIYVEGGFVGSGLGIVLKI